jgi:hypothetical protein
MAKKKKKNIQSTNAQNEKVTLEKRQAKKDVVLGTEKKGRLPLMVAVVCSVLIVGVTPLRSAFRQVFLKTVKPGIFSMWPVNSISNILS